MNWQSDQAGAAQLMIFFVRAAREESWRLHPCALADMLPCFFACSHCNYARYDCISDLLAMKDEQNNKTTTTDSEEAWSGLQATHQIV